MKTTKAELEGPQLQAAVMDVFHRWRRARQVLEAADDQRRRAADEFHAIDAEWRALANGVKS